MIAGLTSTIGGPVITLILLVIAAAIGIAGWKHNHHKAVIGVAIGLLCIMMATLAVDQGARANLGAWMVSQLTGWQS